MNQWDKAHFTDDTFVYNLLDFSNDIKDIMPALDQDSFYLDETILDDTSDWNNLSPNTFAYAKTFGGKNTPKISGSGFVMNLVSDTYSLQIAYSGSKIAVRFNQGDWTIVSDGNNADVINLLKDYAKKSDIPDMTQYVKRDPDTGVASQDINFTGNIKKNGVAIADTDDLKSLVTEQLAQTITLVSKNEGSLDDTLQIQNAINAASAGNGLVKLQKGKTYIVGRLMPKENVTIDLNGSTLKLKDQTELPLFYDDATTNNPKRKNFSVINGVLDGNMQNNQAVNQSSGIFWLMGWDGLFFDRLVIKNAFRNIFNFYRCYNIGIPNVMMKGNGMENAKGFYSCGADFDLGCKNIKIGNFVVKDMYGFGIHFNNVEDYQADNLTFINLTHPSAVAITFTQAKRGVINNISCDGVLGNSIEINATKDLEIKNLSVNGSGNRSIIYGDNGTGEFNERVNLDNVTTTNTGGGQSISVCWAKNCEIKHAEFDKGLGTLDSIVVENCRFVDTKFNVPLSDPAYLYNSRFKFINTEFTDVVLQRVENTIFEIGNVGPRVVINDTETVDIPFTYFDKNEGPIGGKLQVMSYMPGNPQGTYQEIGFVQYGSTFNLVESLVVDGSFPRKLTVTADATNKKIILTNSTGQTLMTTWNVIGQ